MKLTGKTQSQWYIDGLKCTLEDVIEKAMDNNVEVMIQQAIYALEKNGHTVEYKAEEKG